MAVQRYRPIDAALLRASAHTPETAPCPPWPADDDPTAEEWRDWIATGWRNASFARAVTVASPALASQVEAMIERDRSDRRKARRIALALAGYLVRMHGRAVPFGLFAGVSPARFARVPSVRWSAPRLRVRADAEWLAGVIARLESCTPLLRRLTVVGNDLTAKHGSRLVVPWQPHAGTVAAGGQVSLRAVPVVDTIRNLAQEPVSAADLMAKVASEHPGVSEPDLEGVVAQLVRSGVLISALRPPGTATDGLSYLLARLDAVDAVSLTEIRPMFLELREINAELRAADLAVPETTAERMRAMVSAAQPVAVDLRLGCAVVLPTEVAAEAAVAAEVLVRLAPPTPATVAWRAYHRAFLDQFGPGALVPVEQLVATLGLPAHFTQGEDARQLAARDERLLALAQRAALDGIEEVLITAPDVEALAGDQTGPAPHGDVWFDVQAATADDLAAGRFLLGISGFGRSGAGAGRFLDLLDEEDQQRVSKAYLSLPPAVTGALPVQLSFPPDRVHTENVVRAPQVLPDVIALAEHRASRHIRARDLAVTADGDRMDLVLLPARRVVEPLLPHAGARHTVPPLARLMFELPRAHLAPLTVFDWGAAASLPFLPRLRYGRSIFAPARWRLDPRDLPGQNAPAGVWADGLAEVRSRRNLPDIISVGDGDRQLRLDLDNRMHLALLRAHLDAGRGPVTATEAPTQAGHAWIGRAHEIVTPLLSTAAPESSPRVLASTAPLPLTVREQTSVVSVKVTGPPELLDEVLVQHLPALLGRWDEPRWWFTRSRQGAPHLRLRIHDGAGRTAGHVAAWAADLRPELIGDVTVCGYHPETARYGPGPAMDAAHDVFTADSAAALAQLRALSRSRELLPPALTAASMLDFARAVTGSTPAAMAWWVAHPEAAAGAGPMDRAVLRQTLQLTEDPALLASVTGGPSVAEAWQARDAAAARYAERLTPDVTRVTSEMVLTSLLHMHYVRAVGVDPDGEAAVGKLARAGALAWTSLHRSKR